MSTTGITRLFPRAEFFPWDRAILKAIQLENTGQKREEKKHITHTKEQTPPAQRVLPTQSKCHN